MHVSKRYTTEGQTVIALDRVTLSVPSGSVTAVTGPSGSGKSTLLHVIGAMDRADSGSIKVGDIEISILTRAQQAAYRQTIGFVFQRFHLLPALTTLDNVIAPVIPFRTRFDKHVKARELLELVGLSGREGSLPSRLSGGEQQRVAIARALIHDPALLLADEPTGNLDSGTSNEIMQLLLDLREQRTMTVLIATHNPLIYSRCDRVVRLEDGRVAEDIDVRRSADPDQMLGRIRRLDPGL
jgi:putative ABC transport system ATP-binding protein